MPTQENNISGIARNLAQTPRDPNLASSPDSSVAFCDLTDASFTSEYRTLFEHMREGVGIYAPLRDTTGSIRDYRLVAANPALAEHLGYPTQNIIGSTVLTMLPDLEPVWIQKANEIVEKGRQIHTVRHAPALGRTLELHGFRSINGSLVCIVRDVTEQQHAERTLKLRTSQLETAQRLAHLGSWTIDLTANAILWSDEMYRIFERDPALGVPSRADYVHYVHPDDRERRRQNLETAIAEGRGCRMEFRLQMPNGRIKHIVSIADTETDTQEQVVRVHGTTQDVTEHVRAEEERQRLEQHMRMTQKMESLGMVAGGIAHDFNNILMAVLGNIELVMQDTVATAPNIEPLTDARNATLRAAELCKQMLAYAGKARLVLRPVDLSDAVRDIAGILSAATPANIRLELNLGEKLPAAQADLSQIRQLIMNLVLNATEAIGDAAGTIRIATHAMECTREDLARTWIDENLPPGLYTSIEVADDGAGIDPHILPRIFDPFFSTRFAGRGLGLAAVLGIARAHRGALRVETAPGAGSVFRVFLPAIQSPDRNPA